VSAPTHTPWPSPRHRGGLRDEGGFVAGAEALVFGVLIFVIGTLVVVNAWSVIDAKFATSAAAREATRAAVAAAPGTDLNAVAEAAARSTLEGYGRDATGAVVRPVGATTLERCAEVGYVVEISVPAAAFVGVAAPASFTVTGRHHELVDPYRSGLPVPDPAEGGSCVL
jgi:hypothetical protein